MRPQDLPTVLLAAVAAHFVNGGVAIGPFRVELVLVHDSARPGIVDADLHATFDVLDGEECKIVHFLVVFVFLHREAARVGVARVVDEPHGRAKVCAIDVVILLGRKPVQRVDVRGLVLVRLVFPSQQLRLRDDFSEVQLDELALDNIHRRPDAKPAFLRLEDLEGDSPSSADDSIPTVGPARAEFIAFGDLVVLSLGIQLLLDVLVGKNNNAVGTLDVCALLLASHGFVVFIAHCFGEALTSANAALPIHALTAEVGVWWSHLDPRTDDIMIGELELAMQPRLVEVIGKSQGWVKLLLEAVGKDGGSGGPWWD